MVTQLLVARGMPKASQADARYTPAGGRERCGGCRHFMAPSVCNRILGPVTAVGWCRYYSQKPPQRAANFPGMGPSGMSLDLNFMQPGTLDPRITFTRASTGTYFNSAGVMQTAAINAPRWDYNPATLALQGLLIEEARTNLAFPSIPGSGWGVLSGALTPASGIAPDGTNTMARLSEDGSNNFHLIIAPLLTIVAANVYTLSVFAKMQENRYLQLIVDDNSASGTQANFDLQTGSVTVPAVAVGSGSNVSSNIQSIGNGVYRCSIACATNTSTTGRAVLVLINTPTTPKFGTYQGNPANGLLVWGAQVEQGAFPTSYIPTTGAAVTRAQDQCAISPANMSPWYNTTTGSWSAEFIYLNPVPTNNRVVASQGAPAGGGATTVFVDSTQHASQYDGVAAVSTTNTLVTNAISKVASTWAASVGKTCGNGGTVASGAMTGGYAVLNPLGMFFLTPANAGNADNTTGYIRRVRYWPRVLTDAEMQSVTT